MSPSQILTLASGSEARARLLAAAGVPLAIRPARVDEEAIREALQAEGAPPRDVADLLAEAKARKGTRPGLVLGADQVLEHRGRILSKPRSPDDAMAQLSALRGDTHHLHAAAVIAEDGQPVWRHVATARMTMRAASDGYLADYAARNWDAIRHCVGCYQVEAEGVRLFSRIDGDHFVVQGLPLLQILDFLAVRGVVAS